MNKSGLNEIKIRSIERGVIDYICEYYFHE